MSCLGESNYGRDGMTYWQDVIVVMIAVLICVAVCMGIYDGCMNGSIPLNGNTIQTSYTVRIVDGCEYIETDKGLTHKGNCKNPDHLK